MIWSSAVLKLTAGRINQFSISAVQQHTFVCNRDGAVEVLFLQSPCRVIYLSGDTTETIAVHFDGCRWENTNRQCIECLSHRDISKQLQHETLLIRKLCHYALSLLSFPLWAEAKRTLQISYTDDERSKIFHVHVGCIKPSRRGCESKSSILPPTPQNICGNHCLNIFTC